MVLVDRTEPEPTPRRKVSKLGVVAAAGVAAAAMVVTGNLTTVPEADEPTDTTLPIQTPGIERFEIWMAPLPAGS